MSGHATDPADFGRIARAAERRRLQPTDAHLEARACLATAMADLDAGVLAAALGEPHAQRKLRWAAAAVRRALLLIAEVRAQVRATAD